MIPEFYLLFDKPKHLPTAVQLGMSYIYYIVLSGSHFVRQPVRILPQNKEGILPVATLM